MAFSHPGRYRAPHGSRTAKSPTWPSSLSQCNEMIDDIPMVEANGLTTHVTTVRTALPKGSYIRYYQGTPYTKSNAAQIEFGMSLLRDYSQVDKELCKLGGQESVQREKEDVSHMEGLSQQQSTTLVYGNSWTTPEQFTGFAPFFNTVSTATAQNAVNVFDCGGTGSSNASIRLIGWGDNDRLWHLSEGLQGQRLVFEDKGDVVPGFDSSQEPFRGLHFDVPVAAGSGRRRLALYRPPLQHRHHHGGLAWTDAARSVRDPVARNRASADRGPYCIGHHQDRCAGQDGSGHVGLEDVPRDRTACARRSDVQAIRDKNVLLSPTDYAGRPIVNWRNVPMGARTAAWMPEARV